MIDVSDVLDDFKQTIIYRVTTVTTVNFQPTETIVDTNIEAVVQVAQKENLNVQAIDWSKQYLQIHANDPLKIGQKVVYKSKEFKIIDLNDYSDYGYYEITAEEIKWIK